MTLPDELHVDPADVEVIVEWWRSCGGSDDLEDVLRDVLSADERTLAWAGTPAARLAARYRLTGDETLLDELRERGHHHIVGHLRFEQPQPGDSDGVLGTRSLTREVVDMWIATDPPDPYQGERTYRLGSPTERTSGTPPFERAV